MKLHPPQVIRPMDQAAPVSARESRHAMEHAADGRTPVPVLAPERCAEIVGGRVVRRGAADPHPGGLAFDSRTARPGDLFVAIEGESADGHAFVPGAYDAGCHVALVADPARVEAAFGEDRVPGDLWLIVTPEPRRALGELARVHRRTLKNTLVIGVTGSVGKTTTCAILNAVLSSGLRGVSPRGSFNNDIGVPVTVLDARPEDGFLICEIGMSTPGEIARMGGVASPGACIITGAGRAHLEGVGSVEKVAIEKASLAACADPGAPGGGRVYANASSRALARRLLELIERGQIDPQRVVWFGSGETHVPGAVTLIEEITGSEAGVSFSVDGAPFELPMSGAHNALNAGAAVLVARDAGLDDAQIRRGLLSTRPPAMRMERSEVGGVRFVNDAYNANPDSMAAAIAWFSSAAGERKVLVLGDMLELGDRSAALHEELLDSLSRSDAGGWRVELVGPEFRAAAERVGLRVGCHEPSDEGMRAIAGGLREGDVVLLKGSRGMRLERIISHVEGVGP